MPDATQAKRSPDISPPPFKRRKIGNTDQGDVSVVPAAPSEHWLRVFSWNVNGIASFIQPSITSFLTASKKAAKDSDMTGATSLRTLLRRHHWPQIFELQEVKINPTDEQTQRAVEKAVNLIKSPADQGPQYVVRFCLPNDKFNARGFGRKVYGVATIIRQDFYQKEVESVRTVDWDVEGRVLVVETRSKLSIWNIYAVNGTDNAYRDPVTGEVVGTRHDKKLAFHKHMMEECKKLEAEGYQLILGGDLNVARGPIDGYPNLRTRPEQHVHNRYDFNQKFFEAADGLRGIDAFRHLHPQEKKYTWVARNRPWKASCDRVDLFILSRGLVEMSPKVLAEADILMTPADRGPSDHVPLYVALDMSCVTRRGSSEETEVESVSQSQKP